MSDEDQQYGTGNPQWFYFKMAVCAIVMCGAITVMIWTGWEPPIPSPWIQVCIIGGFALLAAYAQFARRKLFEGVVHPLFIVRLASCTLPLIPIVLAWVGLNYLLDDGPWGGYEHVARYVGISLVGIAFIIAGLLRFVGKDVECERCKTINPDPDGEQFCCNCASDLTETGYYVNEKLKPIWLSIAIGVGLLVLAAWSFVLWPPQPPL